MMAPLCPGICQWRQRVVLCRRLALVLTRRVDPSVVRGLISIVLTLLLIVAAGLLTAIFVFWQTANSGTVG